jgi:predicted Zn-dependent protease
MHENTMQRPTYLDPVRAMLIALLIALGSYISSSGTSIAASPAIIRDAEIEALLRDYTIPLFKAAGLPTSAVDVVIIYNTDINAFVTSGQRIFIHTGLITESATPNEVIGVLAHETGHIAGGHHARTRDEISRASISNTVAILAGLVAAGGVAAAGGSHNGAAAVGGIFGGAQSAIKRSFLSYAREQESAADQAALRFLDETGQSAAGMLTMFDLLSDQMMVSVRNIDPYLQSHPLPRERINILKQIVQSSPYYRKNDSSELLLRHEFAQAKILAYLGQPSKVFRKYKNDATSLPATYARAITYFRNGDLNRSIIEIDKLIDSLPNYPYFYEIKGQAFLESGRAHEAIPVLKKAVNLAPNSPLIRILLGQAIISTNDPGLLDTAITQLSRALVHERRSPVGYRFLAIAYSRKGQTGRAELASANEYSARGDFALAIQFAKRAKDKFRPGTTEWEIAEDIINIKSR